METFLENFAKKKSHEAELTCTKSFGQRRDSKPRSAWQTTKKPN